MAKFRLEIKIILEFDKEEGAGSHISPRPHWSYILL
jgi:hypothetical protein